jgi:hypothetical protein
MTMTHATQHPAQQLADRYAAVWNEADHDTRRAAIASLFAPDGVHYVGTRVARGHAALEDRVVGAYEKNVRDAGHRFRAQPNAQSLRGVVTFHWEMIEPATGEVLAVGLEFLQLGEDGRIACDHQFMVS